MVFYIMIFETMPFYAVIKKQECKSLSFELLVYIQYIDVYIRISLGGHNLGNV